jgi:hypothetical protein
VPDAILVPIHWPVCSDYAVSCTHSELYISLAAAWLILTYTPFVLKYTTLLTFYFNFDHKYPLNKLVN